VERLEVKKRCHVDGNMEHNFLNDFWTEIYNSSKTSNEERPKKKKKIWLISGHKLPPRQLYNPIIFKQEIAKI
jgi:hypothetical protein